MGERAPHRAEKKLGVEVANFQGKVVNAPPGSVHPRRQNKSPFLRKSGEICTARVVNLVVVACVVRATTKKERSSAFSGKKSAPPEKIFATPMCQSDKSESVNERVHTDEQK